MKVRRAYRRVDRNSVEVYYTPVDDISGADIILTAIIEDRWDKIYFSDEEHSYIILKKPQPFIPFAGEEPLLSNYDWGYIFRIYAIIYWKPFNLDVQRSDNRELFFLEIIPKAEGTPSFVDLLDFSGCVYCGEDSPCVRINDMCCYTWVSYPDTPLWVFNLVGGQIGYFV